MCQNKRINITLRQFVRKNQEAIMSKKAPRGIAKGKTRQPVGYDPVKRAAAIDADAEPAPRAPRQIPIEEVRRLFAKQRAQEKQPRPPAPPAPTSFRQRAASTGQGPVTRSRSQKSLELPAAPPTQATSRPGGVANNTRAKAKGFDQYNEGQVTGVITASLKIQEYVETRPNGPEGRAVMVVNPDNDYIILTPIDTPEQARDRVNNTNNELNAVRALEMGKTVIVIFNFQNPPHWTGAVIKRTGNNPIRYTAYYIDPLGRKYELRGRNNMAHVFFQELLRHVRLEDIHEFQIVQQNDGTSCGPLTAENMIMLAQAPVDAPINVLEEQLKQYSDKEVELLRKRQLALLRQSVSGRIAADGVEVSEKAAEDEKKAVQDMNKRRRAEAAAEKPAAKGAKGNEGDEGEGEGEEAEGDDLILDFTVEDEEQGVKDGMPDGDLNGVRRNRAVNWGRNNPNRPGGPNNPDEDGIPHYTKFLYNTKDDFPEREILLEPRETKDDNDRYRRLAGELLAYARWGKAQRRDIGDLVVRGNNALLANRIITGDEYDARNARIRKRNVFGGPGDDRPYARETYDEYKDKNPLIVGQNIGKKIRKYVIQASRIWPTHAQPARPFDYVDIFNPL
jgi:hypothetical protein